MADQIVLSPSAVKQGEGGTAVHTSTSISWLHVFVPVLKSILMFQKSGDALGSFTRSLMFRTASKINTHSPEAELEEVHIDI